MNEKKLDVMKDNEFYLPKILVIENGKIVNIINETEEDKKLIIFDLETSKIYLNYGRKQMLFVSVREKETVQNEQSFLAKRAGFEPNTTPG